MADERAAGINEMEGQYDPEPEFYIEPTTMKARDTIGVIVALLALAAIGLSGYIWLNPDLGLSSIMQGQSQLAQLPTSSKNPKSETPAVATPAAQHISCPYCGMFADQSEGQVRATFGAGMPQLFDSWDCVFKLGAENKLELVESQVMEHGSPSNKPKWLNAEGAFYLYDTIEIVGSMPPYAAAFPDRAAAEKASATMDGELVNFDGLKAKWDQK